MSSYLDFIFPKGPLYKKLGNLGLETNKELVSSPEASHADNKADNQVKLHESVGVNLAQSRTLNPIANEVSSNPTVKPKSDLEIDPKIEPEMNRETNQSIFKIGFIVSSSERKALDWTPESSNLPVFWNSDFRDSSFESSSDIPTGETSPKVPWNQYFRVSEDFKSLLDMTEKGIGIPLSQVLIIDCQDLKLTKTNSNLFSILFDKRKKQQFPLLSLGAKPVKMFASEATKLSLVHGKTLSCSVAGTPLQYKPVYHPEFFRINRSMKVAVWNTIKEIRSDLHSSS